MSPRFMVVVCTLFALRRQIRTRPQQPRAKARATSALGARAPFGSSHLISALYDFFLMFDRGTREPPPGVALGVTPNAVLESIDSGDFLAG